MTRLERPSPSGPGLRALGRVTGLGLATLAGLVPVVCLGAIALALGGGYRAYAEVSDSMGPRVHAGDLVVTRTIPAAAARAGEVITFRDPARGRALVTHRLLATRAGGAGALEMRTKGDAAGAADRPWRIGPGGRVGRVEAVVPRLGRLAVTAPARAALVDVAAALLTLFVLWRLWRPRPRQVLG